ncbi:MAG: hypothetical protein K2O62_02730 [Clostridia bacterium]|nr:hypothetical protein [Clostridia bacterium]
MIKYRNIGIKKDISLRMAFCGIPLIVLLFLCIVIWGFYFVDDTKDELLIKYGVEVEAEIYKYSPVWHGDDIGYMYETKYRYIESVGHVFIGSGLEYGSADDAAKHIGDKIIITIVPSSISPDEQISVPIRYADLCGPKYSLHLALAICCTAPIPLLAYLLCYRGF